MTNRNEKLPILVGVRIRLDDTQRETLKAAWRQVRDAVAPEEPQRIGASAVSTKTAYNVTKQLGISEIVMADMLGSRESLPLPSVLAIQHHLDCEVITEKQIMEACKSYCNYVFSIHAKV